MLEVAEVAMEAAVVATEQVEIATAVGVTEVAAVADVESVAIATEETMTTTTTTTVTAEALSTSETSAMETIAVVSRDLLDFSAITAKVAVVQQDSAIASEVPSSIHTREISFTTVATPTKDDVVQTQPLVTVETLTRAVEVGTTAANTFRSAVDQLVVQATNFDARGVIQTARDVDHPVPVLGLLHLTFMSFLSVLVVLGLVTLNSPSNWFIWVLVTVNVTVWFCISAIATLVSTASTRAVQTDRSLVDVTAVETTVSSLYALSSRSFVTATETAARQTTAKGASTEQAEQHARHMRQALWMLVYAFVIFYLSWRWIIAGLAFTVFYFTHHLVADLASDYITKAHAGREVDVLLAFRWTSLVFLVLAVVFSFTFMLTWGSGMLFGAVLSGFAFVYTMHINTLVVRTVRASDKPTRAVATEAFAPVVNVTSTYPSA
ncbi:hypothetical protein BC828DRAFT_374832 [Blastocladiella britannica]|nr:hypothetical protein BC828DRAFT_374832 [Blastocladiella britannica]